MNGTVIDIPGISISVHEIPLQDSTDKYTTLKIKDEEGKEVEIQIVYGKITNLFSCKK